ncbi:hypothetical protein YC2023_059340 [Brassica napus]
MEKVKLFGSFPLQMHFPSLSTLNGLFTALHLYVSDQPRSKFTGSHQFFYQSRT